MNARLIVKHESKLQERDDSNTIRLSVKIIHLYLSHLCDIHGKRANVKARETDTVTIGVNHAPTTVGKLIQIHIVRELKMKKHPKTKEKMRTR